MGFAHNNVLHSNHFRKDWQRRVRTWLPARLPPRSVTSRPTVLSVMLALMPATLVLAGFARKRRRKRRLPRRSKPLSYTEPPNPLPYIGTHALTLFISGSAHLYACVCYAMHVQSFHSITRKLCKNKRTEST
ncbi:hypothetical protein RSAG8_01511, partial [Rhizoctonia solani AG-8 WAC10335]